jgi:hypothetical protein
MAEIQVFGACGQGTMKLCGIAHCRNGRANSASIACMTSLNDTTCGAMTSETGMDAYPVKGALDNFRTRELLFSNNHIPKAHHIAWPHGSNSIISRHPPSPLPLLLSGSFEHGLAPACNHGSDVYKGVRSGQVRREASVQA